MGKAPINPVVDGVTYDLATPEGRAKTSELKTAIMRLRNFGASLQQIADQLRIDIACAEGLHDAAIAEIRSEPASAIAARHQQVLHDVRRAMYGPTMAGDTKAATVLMKVQDSEAKLHGLHAPMRIHHGLDPETFTTTVTEDLRTLGMDPAALDPAPHHPDDEEDDEWSNT